VGNFSKNAPDSQNPNKLSRSSPTSIFFCSSYDFLMQVLKKLPANASAMPSLHRIQGPETALATKNTKIQKPKNRFILF
jgi:hypothetical protein